MRFFLFDRVLEYKAGESSCGIKNVSIQEEFLIDHYERQPLMPSPLIVEALAQLGGWTVTTSGEHRYLAVMVRIKGLQVLGSARPGDQIVLRVSLDAVNDFGATISAEALVDDQVIVKVANITYVLYEIPEEDRIGVKEQYTRLNGEGK